MKANDAKRTVSGANSPKNHSRKSHSPYRYQKVLDGRKQPIRGLWQRNGKFIARISTEGEVGMARVKWVPLEEATTIPQAVEALKSLHLDRAGNVLPVLSQTPKFSDYVKTYLEWIKSGQGTKKQGTIEKEEGILERWTAHLGGTRLDKIKPAHVSAFMQKRLNTKWARRTVKLDVRTRRRRRADWQGLRAFGRSA